MNPAANRSTTQVVIGAPHPSPAGNHRNQQHQPAPPIGVVISGVSRPVSEPLDPDSQKTFEAILAKYGIKPQTAAQSALSAAGTAAGAASSAMCLQIDRWRRRYGPLRAAGRSPAQFHLRPDAQSRGKSP